MGHSDASDVVFLTMLVFGEMGLIEEDLPKVVWTLAQQQYEVLPTR
jgi:hypothetical protein